MFPQHGELVMNILRALVISSVILLLALGTGACNTIKGAGQDLEAAGGAIEKSAEKKKRY